MKITKIILILAFIIIDPSEILSQDNHLSFRYSVSKYFPNDKRIVFNDPDNYPFDNAEETDRSSNFGIIIRLFSNKFLELEAEKYNFYEKKSFGENSESYETYKTSVDFMPLTLSFVHRVVKFGGYTSFYRIGISWYPVEIEDTITNFDLNASDVQIYLDSYRKNTYGLSLSAGVSYKIKDLFSIIFSLEQRFVNDLTLDLKEEQFNTYFDGFLVKAGLLFEIF
ncbi:hypothetical protein ACFL6O_01380 [candidate division KSB1 bacterium]